MPPAEACVNTGPRLATTKGSSPSKAGIQVGHHPDEPAAARPVGLESGRRVLLVPGAEGAGAVEGIGRPGRAGDEGMGRSERPGLTTTQRPDRGSRRSWFMAVPIGEPCGPTSRLPSSHRFSFLSLPPPLRYRFRRPVEAALFDPAGSWFPGRHPPGARSGGTCADAPAHRRGVRRGPPPARRLRRGRRGDRTRRRHDGGTVARVRVASSAALPEPLRRYFRPGFNWAGRIVYGIPVFGWLLVAMSSGAYSLGEGWVLAGLALFVAVVLVGEGVLWPAERRLQRVVTAGGAGGDGDAGSGPARRRAMERAGARCWCCWWPGWS